MVLPSAEQESWGTQAHCWLQMRWQGLGAEGPQHVSLHFLPHQHSGLSTSAEGQGPQKAVELLIFPLHCVWSARPSKGQKSESSLNTTFKNHRGRQQERVPSASVSALQPSHPVSSRQGCTLTLANSCYQLVFLPISQSSVQAHRPAQPQGRGEGRFRTAETWDTEQESHSCAFLSTRGSRPVQVYLVSRNGDLSKPALVPSESLRSDGCGTGFPHGSLCRRVEKDSLVQHLMMTYLRAHANHACISTLSSYNATLATVCLVGPVW